MFFLEVFLKIILAGALIFIALFLATFPYGLVYGLIDEEKRFLKFVLYVLVGALQLTIIITDGYYGVISGMLEWVVNIFSIIWFP